MKYRTRTYYTDAQKAVMWERRKQGWTLHQIAQLFDRAHTSVQGIWSNWWHQTTATKRAATAMTLAEREDISRAMAKGQSIRSIARKAWASCIDSQSRAQPQRRASGLPRQQSRHRRLGQRFAQCCKLAKDRAFAQIATDKLRLLWSPSESPGGSTSISVQQELSRVAQDHLSKSVHSGARSLEEGTPATPEAYARHRSVSAPQQKRASMARSSVRCRSASALHQSRIALCQVTGRAI